MRFIKEFPMGSMSGGRRVTNMKRLVIPIIILPVALILAVGLFNFFDDRFPFGRMWETPAARPHETVLPVMEDGGFPVDGEDAVYRRMEGRQIKSPLKADDVAAMAAGRKLYGIYCAQCHGTYMDGNGTVGQSFQPLPADLTDRRVAVMSAGDIFKAVSYGNPPNGRQPPLASTIAVSDRWKIITYVRAVANREGVSR
jgi:mono/diheme cytochrome c family protein